MTEAVTDLPWSFRRIGLIVTGVGEREFLARLFNRSIGRTGDCNFEVIAKIGQTSPRTSEKKIAKMVGQGKKIPDRDATTIGVKARQFLNRYPEGFVILVDDLEFRRKDSIHLIFQRYKSALDEMTLRMKDRTSVHFLVYMLEAYYFADAAALNFVFGGGAIDYAGDVETIPHPKQELKRTYPGFDEIGHGTAIIQKLDLAHVLARIDTCRSLRTLVRWCFAALRRELKDEFQLLQGECQDVTSPQIAAVAGLH